MTSAGPAQRSAPSQYSDKELARLVQAGSLSCFDELARRHEARLLGFLYRRTGNVHDAEDLLQETFARAFENIAQYDARWRLSTWLFTIASRLAASHYRRAQIEKRCGAALPAPPQQDPAEVVLQREQSRNLWDLARRTLPDSQSTALWLRYVEDLSVREIACVMGKTSTHVKVLLFRGRSGLAKYLRSAGSQDPRTAQVPPCPPHAKTAKEGGRCSA